MLLVGKAGWFLSSRGSLAAGVVSAGNINFRSSPRQNTIRQMQQFNIQSVYRNSQRNEFYGNGE